MDKNLNPRYRFNRLELAGSLGDLGTLLPLALGMILVNGLNPTGIFFTIGLFYVLSGVYYGVTVPVQPMKVIGAYAIATGLSAHQVLAAGALMGIFLLVIGASGAISLISRYTPGSVVRGVQLSVGALLIRQGVQFIIGTSRFQELQKAAEPYLSLSTLGPIPIGIAIGIVAGILTLLLLENKKLPASLVVIGGGIAIGLIFGTNAGLDNLRIGIHLPDVLPFGWPGAIDFSMALVLLVLPQVPMTLGNAVIAYVDLSENYYKEASSSVTYRRACISMALANFVSFFFGGMPMCHGAGGLAAHYRFGARTAGSNIFIGAIFVIMALLLGDQVVIVSRLIPISVLGVLLIFAGAQLAMTIRDVRERKALFVTLLMLGITLASNLAVAFVTGMAMAWILKSKRLAV